MKMKIHQEGREILLVIFAVLVVLNILAYYFIELRWVCSLILVASIIFYMVVVNFFRSPRRIYRGNFDRNINVIAPADGKIVALEEVMENEFFHEKRLQLSIFMNLFNVHANWFPVEGEVIHVSHQDGRFRSAFLPKSSIENERSTVVIKTGSGENIMMRQIAGAMARRIVTYAEPGDNCSIDEHMGFIKFGSRVDLFLPIGTKVYVKLGDRTTGGMTHVADLPVCR